MRRVDRRVPSRFGLGAGRARHEAGRGPNVTAIQMAILVAVMLGGIAVMLCVLLVAIRREVDALEQAVHCECTILHDYIDNALDAGSGSSIDDAQATRQGFKSRRALINRHTTQRQAQRARHEAGRKRLHQGGQNVSRIDWAAVSDSVLAEAEAERIAPILRTGERTTPQAQRGD